MRDKGLGRQTLAPFSCATRASGEIAAVALGRRRSVPRRSALASIQNRNGSYKLPFCYLGRRHYLTLGKVTEMEAEAKSAQVDEHLLRIRQKLVRVPPGVAIEEFVLHDGQVARPEEAVAAPLPFARFRQLYRDTHRNGAMEADSLDTVEIHLDHRTEERARRTGRVRSSFP